MNEQPAEQPAARLLTDAEWGIRESVHDGDDGFVIARTQHVADHVDWCRAAANEGRHGSRDMRLVASIPLTVIEAYMRTHGVSAQDFARDRAHMRRIVNDPAFADLRIAPGKI